MKAKLAFQDDPAQWLRYARHLATRQAGAGDQKEDAVQAGILRMMPALARLDRNAPAKQIRAYLRRFLLRGIQEHLQRHGRPVNHNTEIEPAVEGFLRHIEDFEQRRLVVRAMQRLPNIDRVILSRLCLRGWNRAAIAAHLGCSPASVVTMRDAAVERMRNVIRSRWPALGDQQRPSVIRRARRSRVEHLIETRGRKRLMARCRDLRPEVFQDKRLKDAEDKMGFVGLVRITWLGLQTQADSQGLFRWDVNALKKAILPEDTVNIAAILSGLEMNGFIVHYEVDGKAYGWIRGFKREQRPKTHERRRGPLHPEPESIAGYRKWRGTP